VRIAPLPASFPLPPQPVPLLPARTKVYSDIDDTFYSHYKDKTYPKRAVYPGVRELYRELGVSAASDLTFLTARHARRASGHASVWRAGGRYLHRCGHRLLSARPHRARVAHAASAQQTTITFGKPEKKAASDTAIQRALAAVSQLSS